MGDKTISVQNFKKRQANVLVGFQQFPEFFDSTIRHGGESMLVHSSYFRVRISLNFLLRIISEDNVNNFFKFVCLNLRLDLTVPIYTF